MEEEYYDEFGNYIGPDLPEDDDGEDGEADEYAEERADDDGYAAHPGDADPGADRPEAMEMDSGDGQIVLHEDKRYYPTLHEVYGEDVEATVQIEDTQPITQPIIAPAEVHDFDLSEPPGVTTYSTAFLQQLFHHPGLVRNVAVIGTLGHGKTSLADLLIESTHPQMRTAGLAKGAAPRADTADEPRKRTAASLRAHDGGRVWSERRYLDSRKDEQARGLSIKATPISLVLQTSRDKSYAVNLVDAPGHVCFADEGAAAMRLSDGVLLCVDVVEGLLMPAERLLRQAVADGQRVVLVLTKLDRLIVELRLPPADAYHKLRHTIGAVNALLRDAAVGAAPALDGVERPAQRVDPRDGSVLFASAIYGVVFSLESFARLYAQAHAVALDERAFALRLWGDAYRRADGTFATKPPAAGAVRSFVELVLAPLYKLVALGLSAPDAGSLRAGLEAAGIGGLLTEQVLSYDPKPLVRAMLCAFCGPPTALADAVARHLPSPVEGAAAKVAAIYTGDVSTAAGRAMLACDASGPLVACVAKLVHEQTCERFDCLIRVLSGTLAAGSSVRVLGEAYCLEDEEDSAQRTVGTLELLQGRYRLPLDAAPAGCWCLASGIDGSLLKTGTLVDARAAAPHVAICAPLRFAARAVLKVAIEPLRPSELPKMVDGVRKLCKAYPALQAHVEESGEHVLIGCAELYLDCALHDLRVLYGKIELKVADPAVTFCETVADTSALRCTARTPNGRNGLAMIAEPLEPALAAAAEAGRVPLNGSKAALTAYLKGAHGWDALAARSLWALGPDVSTGCNALLDDCLPSEADRDLLVTIREHIIQGFRWGTREGPLCDEPMRNVKLKLVGADICAEPIHRGGGQLIPTARRVAYSAFLTASPRLLEPIMAVEITAPADCVPAVYTVLSRRRGHVVSDAPRAGTPLYVMKAFLPAIDSFGFETDLRAHTQGQAFALSVFDHWDTVPGDPLDRSIVLRPLEPQPVQHLAREFMVKTRRRKGLSADVSVQKFFDEDTLSRLAQLSASAQPF